MYTRILSGLALVVMILLAGCSSSNPNHSSQSLLVEEELGRAPSRGVLLQTINTVLRSHGYEFVSLYGDLLETEWREWEPVQYRTEQEIVAGRDRYMIQVLPRGHHLFVARVKHECEVLTMDESGVSKRMPCVMEAAYASVKRNVRLRLDRHIKQAPY